MSLTEEKKKENGKRENSCFPSPLARSIDRLISSGREVRISSRSRAEVSECERER